MNIQKELEYLLNNHWVSKEENQDMYYQIKSKISKIIEFVTNKLGSKIVVNQDIIKIEKIPSRVNEAMALKNFDNVIDYVLFMFLLIFLEDKVKGDQFILSNLTMYINDSSVALDIKEKPNWNLYSHRKSLVKILRYASEISILKIKDGNANKFADDIQTEVLYETLGTSYHYVRRFKNDITKYNNYQDFIDDEEDEFAINQNKRRNYIYRSLLYSPVIYFEKEEMINLDYLKNYRNHIENDINDNFSAELLIYKNMALISFENSNNKEYFPNTKAISDIIMLINTNLINDYEKDEFDCITLSTLEFKYLLGKIHDENKILFSKEYREMTIDKFYQEIVDTFIYYNMAEVNDIRIKFYPIIKLLMGYYEYQEETNDFSQLELLLEDVNEEI